MLASVLTPSLNLLLVAIPATLYLAFLQPESHLAIFICACVSIIPLAGWLGRATEQIAHHVGEGLGGFLNATFGNAAELIIAIMALREGYIDVVKASLTGSIIGNILLVLGGSLLAGGLRYPVQQFNAMGVSSQASMLTLAAISFLAPSVFHMIVGQRGVLLERSLSFDISILLLVSYLISLIFSLKTHRDMFGGTAVNDGPDEPVEIPWSVKHAMAVLLVATASIAWMSEILVHSVEQAAQAVGMSRIFVGVIVVAIVGNAAEHSTAILMAMKNRMDLSLGIAIGSSVQIAMFVAPLLVLLSYWIAPQPMDLLFTPAEILAIVASIHIIGQVAGDGRSHWFEGVQLLTVYAIFAALFYCMPVEGAVQH